MAKVLPVIILFLALPLLAVGLILLLRRSKSAANLFLGFILSGITGSIFTAFITFALSTVPISPHETSLDAWYPILWRLLASLYIGFGLGVAIASIAVSPLWLIKMARNYFQSKALLGSSKKDNQETK
jgi:hypothetical protein